METLESLIKTKKAKIGVVGLGYVGTPVACLFSKKGFEVLGFDINSGKIEKINKGENPIEGKEPGLSELLREVVRKGNLKATLNQKLLKTRDVIIVAVETPVNKKGIPEYKALKKAVESIGENLKKETLVIIESTIAPGTMDGLVKPILEKYSGFKAGTDFYLVHCPERVMPGRLLYNLENESRVIGGVNEKSAFLARELYRHIVKKDLDVTDMITAEMTKTVENTYRDVQIALANEIALICEKMDVDFFRLRELVNKASYRNLHLAGAGVGGHCIPKDPWLLVYGAKKKKISPKLIILSRKINEFMPIHMADLVEEALKEKNKSLWEAKIVICGIAYLEESDDIRNSPALSLYKELKRRGAKNIFGHDPYVSEENIEGLKIEKDFEKCCSGVDVLIFTTAHSQYRKINLRDIAKKMKTKILIDGRNIFDKKEVEKLGFVYKGVGK